MIPGWKVKRELWRIVDKIRELPRRLVEPAQRWTYDRTRWQRIKVTGTAEPTGDRYCVLLVYQPDGLAASLLETCRFMTANGYAVMVVANKGLRPEDRDRLAGLVWRVLERPNFGYDFGGYRDGIHFLMREGRTPRFLILMNDSIWFPLNRDTTVIQRLEAADFDMTGLFLHVPARNEYAKEAARRRRKLAEHIESYVTLVPETTYRTPAFTAFWQDYPQTSSKTLTIRRGEIGFSKAMAAAGLRIGALSRRSAFISAMESRPDDFLERTLRYAAYSDDEFAEAGKALLAAPRDDGWRDRALDHIRTVVERRRFNASFPWATEMIFDTGFVKKHAGRLFQLGRIRFLEAVDAGDLAVDNDAALAELRDRVARDKTLLVVEAAAQKVR